MSVVLNADGRDERKLFEMRLEWRAEAVWIADAMGWQRLFRMRLGDGWRLFGLQMEWVGGGYLNCGWD